MPSASSRIDEEKQRNRETRELWHEMGPHRQRVTREILKLCHPGARVCVLGAGNCNDLDLPALTANCKQLVLVDLDQEALELARERQGARAANLELVGNVDVTGTFEIMANGANSSAAMIEAATHFGGPELPGEPFDVMVSACLLSQFLLAARASLPPESAELRRLALALRDRHLALLLRHTVAGGRALVITDIVSSSTAPMLRTCQSFELARLRDQLLAAQNHFFGLNPQSLERYVRKQLAQECGEIKQRPPWLWSFGERCFLVVALVLERQNQLAPTG